MAAWLPIIRTAIPIVAEIIAVARPMFTSKAEDKDRDVLVAEQIAELQSAATRNSESITELAVQLKTALEGIDTAAIEIQLQLKRQRRLAIAAILISASAIVISTAIFLLIS